MRTTACLLLLAAPAAAFLATVFTAPGRFRGGASRSPSLLAAAPEPPFAIVVEVEVKPDRVDDFLAAMKVDVEGSRQEEGCLRFDLLRDMSNPFKFFFYEV